MLIFNILGLFHNFSLQMYELYVIFNIFAPIFNLNVIE